MVMRVPVVKILFVDQSAKVHDLGVKPTKEEAMAKVVVFMHSTSRSKGEFAETVVNELEEHDIAQFEYGTFALINVDSAFGELAAQPVGETVRKQESVQ